MAPLPRWLSSSLAGSGLLPVMMTTTITTTTTTTTIQISQRQKALLGALICIGANTLISLALNVQKLAHLRAEGGEADRGGEQGEEGQSGESRDQGHGESQDQNHDQEQQQQQEQGNGGPNTKFLRSKLWWLGMLLMIVGESGNFGAYGFAPASLVAPLGSVALLANVFIAPLLLKEKFAKSDLLGVVLASVGAAGVVAASSTDSEAGPSGPDSLWQAIKMENFVIYAIVVLIVGVALSVASATRFGERFILVDIGACAIFGGFTVLSTKGVSSLISYGVDQGDLLAAFKRPLSYALIFVLVTTALVQITFLNRALQRFDARKVIPCQFVFFTISAIVGSAVLFRDFERATAGRLVGFFAGCLTTFAGVWVLTARKDDGGHAEGNSHGQQGSEEEGEDGEQGVHQNGKTANGGRDKSGERQRLLDAPSTPQRGSGYGSSGMGAPTFGRSTSANAVPRTSASLTPMTPRGQGTHLLPPSTSPITPSTSPLGRPFTSSSIRGSLDAPYHRAPSLYGRTPPRLSFASGSALPLGAGGYLLIATTPSGPSAPFSSSSTHPSPNPGAPSSSPQAQRVTPQSLVAGSDVAPGAQVGLGISPSAAASSSSPLASARGRDTTSQAPAQTTTCRLDQPPRASSASRATSTGVQLLSPPPTGTQQNNRPPIGIVVVDGEEGLTEGVQSHATIAGVEAGSEAGAGAGAGAGARAEADPDADDGQGGTTTATTTTTTGTLLSPGLRIQARRSGSEGDVVSHR